MMRAAWFLFGLHLAAQAVGFVGVALVAPRPELWASNPLGRAAYSLGFEHGPWLQIAAGAGAVLVGLAARWGWPRAYAALGGVYVIALVAELAGTLTGLPFGGYSYGSALGPKLFDAVPFSIPLSWFGMGAAAFGLLSGLRASRFARIALAAVAMTSWDLVLDPAMSSGAAIVKYWEWTEGGPIFGMPLLNLPGWILVSLLLMWWLDRQNGTAAPPARLSAATYAAGVGFSAALCLAAGWWQPVAAVLVALAGIALATVALGRPRPATAHGSPAASGT